MLRMDIDPDPDRDFPQNQLIEYLQEKIPNCDAAIVSDYGKGLLNSSVLNELALCGKKH